MPVTNAGRRKARRRLRVAAAIAILGLAGCIDHASPESGTSPDAAAAEEKPTAPAPVHFPPSVHFNVRIDALGEANAEQARLLSVLIRQNMGATPARDAHEIVGALDAAPMTAGEATQGLYVVAVLDLKDAGGARLYRAIGDRRVDRPGGGPLTNTDIALLADKLSAKLAAWHGVLPMNFALDDTLRSTSMADEDDMATGSIRTGGIRHEASSASRLHFDIAMGPAPGDGAEALSQALASALSRRAPSGDWDCGCYRLQGRVAVASAERGLTAVTIEWLVAAGDGHPLGRVVQTQKLSPESVSGRWGDLARQAAETAADGVLAVVLPSRPAPPGGSRGG